MPGTLGGLIEAYRGSPEFREQLVPRTRSDYQTGFDYLAAIENIPIAQIDEAAVITFRDRAFTQWKRRFANYVVQVLRLLFSWGRQRNIVPRALAEIPLIRKPRGTPKANRAWTAAECASVLQAAHGGRKAGMH
jgi:hypothetical protein